MTRIGLVAAIALLALGCGDTTTGGTAGTGGTPPPPANVDKTCRDFCANEQGGPSCFDGPPEFVEPCYEMCLSDYQNYGACGDEWIARYDCHLALECQDLVGDCESALEPLEECVRLANNRLYCEATCPELDIVLCEEDIAECVAYERCESTCPELDRQECIESYLRTGNCGGDDEACENNSDCRSFVGLEFVCCDLGGGLKSCRRRDACDAR